MENVERLADLGRALYRIIKDGSFGKAAGVLSGGLIKILKAVRPYKNGGYLRCSLGNIEYTAKLTEFIALLFPFLGDRLEYVPDFLNSEAEGELRLKGKVRIISVLIPAAKIYFNKDVRKAYSTVCEEETPDAVVRVDHGR